MSELDESAVLRLVQMTEERDIALLHVKLGDCELVVSRMSPSEMSELGFGALAAGPSWRPDQPSAGQGPAAPAGEDRPPADPPLPARQDNVPAARPGTGSSVGQAGTTIDAPMVGTFYRSPSPGQPPFVEPGSVVEEGTTVGLIEAMKLFAAVTSQKRGTISDVLVANGDFVEFGQPLMRLDPAER